MKIDRVYLQDGVWKGDVSGAMDSYPAEGLLVVDTSEIPEPEPPIPPVVPSVIIDNAVKGTQGYQHNYVGNWSYGTNIPGWEQGTLSYSLDGSVTMKFNGTGVEWVTEKGPTHGIVGVSIDGGAETLVDLYGAEFAQQLKVWEKLDLTQGIHTIKLRHTGTKNPSATNTYVITDYFKVYNPQEVPDVPVPPVGDIVVSPGQSIKAAVEGATSGKTVQILAGTYLENQINVPIGVSIVGTGTVFIDFTGTPLAQGSESGMIQLKSSSRVNGNQTIDGFTIRGKYIANGGIIVDNRDNVTIKNVKVQETTFFGIWGKNAANFKYFDCECLNTSWASDGWCSGELNIFNLTNMHIHHNKFTNNLKNAAGQYIKGYGIKSMWGHNTLSGIIEHNTFNLCPSSIWKNSSGPNIDIEFHDTWAGAGNVIVRFNKLTNMVSATGNKTTGNAGRWIIEDNELNLQTGSTCHVEVACNNIDIKNNIMRGASIITANFVPNSKYNDCVVDGNDFVSNGVNQGWGGTFLIGPTGVTNFVYKNNRITKGSYTLVKYMGVTGGVSDGGGNVIN